MKMIKMLTNKEVLLQLFEMKKNLKENLPEEKKRIEDMIDYYIKKIGERDPDHYCGADSEQERLK